MPKYMAAVSFSSFHKYPCYMWELVSRARQGMLEVQHKIGGVTKLFSGLLHGMVHSEMMSDFTDFGS